MKTLTKFALAIFIFGFSACGLNGHNNKAIMQTTENERIYGDLNGKAKQLANKYEDDATGKTAEKIEKIRQKLYPR